MVSLKRWYLLSSVLWVALSSVCPAVLAVGPEDAEQWNVKGSITVSITSPANNTYVPINHTQVLTASASDPDCYRVGTTWYDYSDDVTSGETWEDYHMDWGAAEGYFTEMYGTSATYLAPDYSAGYNVRDVYVCVQADDYNRGTDTFGANDPGDAAEMHLKVWQVTVTVSQVHSQSPNNDADDLLTIWGGTTHGWIIPGTPAGATGYHGNTEITGSIPEGPGVTTGYTWAHFRKGIGKYQDGGGWHDLDNTPNWVADGPYGYYDVDSRHPNGVTDVRQIFMQDPPGATVGASNDDGIAAGWTDLSFQYDFKSRVMYGGIRISNEPEWETKFVLDVVEGHWHVVSHTP